MSNNKGKRSGPKPSPPKPSAAAAKPIETNIPAPSPARGGWMGALRKWVRDIQGPLGPKPVPPPAPPALFRRIDWTAFGLTALVVFIGYWWTLAPDLTLEDSGELAVGSYYAGVPHPPGYPVWTLYTYLFTLLPVSNIAYRVGISSAVAGAFACGLVALMISRGSSMIIEGIQMLKNLDRRFEQLLCAVSGFVGGMLIGFNGFMWSQAVIVEVYTLSALSLTAVLVCMLRWIYAPHQRHYLYLAWFWFGITFNNHQSLIVTAIGIQVFILVAAPKLGREMFFWNTLLWLAGLMLGVLKNNAPLFITFNLIGVTSASIYFVLVARTRIRGIELVRNLVLVAALGYLIVLFGSVTNYITTFEGRKGLFILFNLVGLGLLGWLGYLILITTRLGREMYAALTCGLAFLMGAAFYLYMPLASMTNPPLNWGYPRTKTGFIHAFTRGQYERINPTTGVGETAIEKTVSFVDRYSQQIAMYIGGALEEFNLIYLLIGLVPFVFLPQMQKRERAWLIGLTATYILLSFFLLFLLNPAPDRQSRDLNRVFFTASHVVIAMGVGYGLTLIAASLALYYQRFRQWGLWATGAAAAIALIVLLVIFQTGENPTTFNSLLFDLQPTHEFTARLTAVYSFLLALGALALLVLNKSRLPLLVLLALFTLLPIRSIFSHWHDNEQRGHLFGYWFGHDMFEPPFGIYPEMTRDTVLFGGTDPGRFNPTYMIFCESFIPDSKKRDSTFDRRDVYLITQNALADGTYLQYIRAHYNRSTQPDPPFFQEFLRGPREVEANYETNIIARMAIPLDRMFTKLGARIEATRRARGVYPMTEIHTPSDAQSQRAFSEYLTDAQRRLDHDRRFPNEPPQIRPGEDVRIVENKVQVSGQVAVMAINALLARVIFDSNPDHDFFIEESFPLEWMYEYLTPFGIIMKLNREPIAEMTEEMVKNDHEFWTQYSERLIGNWITYDTSIAEVCEFANRLFFKKDQSGYKGDPKFMRDSDGQKAFSKLRSSIAGVYAWRLQDLTRRIQMIQRRPPADQQQLQSELIRLAAEQQRMLKEAEFAFKQSYAFCPYSPEAIFRLVNLLVGVQRVDEAMLIAQTSEKLDPYNAQLQNLIRQLTGMQAQQAQMRQGQPPVPSTFTQLQAEVNQLRQQFRANPTDMPALQRGVLLLDQLLGQPDANNDMLLYAATAFMEFGQPQKVEVVLQRFVKANPNNPEAWFDLAATQALLSKNTAAVDSLREAIRQSDARRSTNPAAADLRAEAQSNARLHGLRQTPEFQQVLTPE